QLAHQPLTAPRLCAASGRYHRPRQRQPPGAAHNPALLIGMFAFTLADEQAATDVVNTIIIVQRDGGLKIDESRAQQGLAVLGSAPGTPSTVYRGVYVLYNRAIFLEVFGSDYDAVLSTFDSIVTQQLIYAPPTVRGR
ncbi:MAG: hypothetical protein ACRDRY_23035, partial [Pseudonocardiaceae bacterium]